MRCLPLLALSLFATAPAIADDELEALLKPCSECHGRDGLAVKPGIPHLDGQKAVYLLDALRSYASGRRKTAVAGHLGLKPAQLQGYAGYYAGQKAVRGKAAVNPELVAKGETLYAGRCADCHFDNGREADEDAPLLAAQDLDYLVAQTMAFRKGERPFPTMMDDAYRGLAEADLVAVAHFFAAQEQTAPPGAKKKRKKKPS
jgi:cytochrome c553